MAGTVRSWTGDLGLADAAFVLILTLALTAVLGLRARRGTGRPELLFLAVLGLYLVGLAVVVLCPLPGLSPPSRVPGAPDPPLLSVNTTLDLHGFLGRGMSNQNRQNLLLTVPFGFVLPFVVRWRGRWLAVACAVLPLVLEGSQLVLSLAVGWAYRGIDLNDWVANTAGGLLGLALFTYAAWLLSLTRFGQDRDPQRDVGGYVVSATQRFRTPRNRHTGRTAATAAVAVIAAAVSLWLLGPADTPDYGNACEGTPPAEAAHPLRDWTAYADHGTLCLTYPDGSTSVPTGSPETVVVPDARGGVTVIGQTPGQTSRVVVTLPDGRSTQATLHHLDGLADWQTFTARLDPARTSGNTAATAPTTARVTAFAADGSRVRP